MSKTNYEQTTLLILRIVIAAIFIYHGSSKLLNVSGTMQFFASLGLPSSLAVIIGILEVVAGILLLIGLWHKGASYILALIIVSALVLVQIPSLFAKGITAAFERDLLILIATLLLASHGPGHLAISRKH